jgi:hypothetical protein
MPENMAQIPPVNPYEHAAMALGAENDPFIQQLVESTHSFSLFKLKLNQEEPFPIRSQKEKRLEVEDLFFLERKG